MDVNRPIPASLSEDPLASPVPTYSVPCESVRLPIAWLGIESPIGFQTGLAAVMSVVFQTPPPAVPR